MARVIYGGGVTEFIGSIGGTTFQSNSSGFIVRKKPIYKLRRTTIQANQINSFVNLSQQYRILSALDKSDWQNFAAANQFTDVFNNVKTITGINYFNSINTFRLIKGLSVLLTPPAFTLPTAFPAYSLTINSNTLVIDTAGTWGTASETVMLFGTRASNSKTSNLNRNLLFLGSFAGNVLNPRNITSIWESATQQIVNTNLFIPGNVVRLAAFKFLNSTGLTVPYTFST
jgi:hypothetical protein